LIFRPAIVDDNVLALDESSLTQTPLERADKVRRTGSRPAAEKSNHGHRRPLCTRHRRPRHRAAEQRDEIAAPDHSITSSARASSVGGDGTTELVDRVKPIGDVTDIRDGWPYDRGGIRRA